MGIIETLALSMGAAWASGINLYATVLTLGLMNAAGLITLPPDLQVLSSPVVLIAAGLMYAIEFFADKIPGVDSGWDAIHTFIRIPAGAVLAAGGMADVSVELGLAAALVGGGLSAASHATKAGMRVLINASPEPFTNIGASLAEDVTVVASVWTAVKYPAVYLAALALAIAVMIWVLPKLWRAIHGLFAKIFGRNAGTGGRRTVHAEVITEPPPPDGRGVAVRRNRTPGAV